MEDGGNHDRHVCGDTLKKGGHTQQDLDDCDDRDEDRCDTPVQDYQCYDFRIRYHQSRR